MGRGKTPPKPPAEPPATKRYDAAMVALLAGEHVEDAIAELASLMHCKRPAVRFQAATKLIELAVEAQAADGAGASRVYVLMERPGGPGEQKPDGKALAGELRKRLTLVS